MKKSAVITRDEWLEALGVAALAPVHPDALTVSELAEKYGLSRRRMSERLNQLVKEGKVTLVRKTIVLHDGHTRRVPAYLLKK